MGAEVQGRPRPADEGAAGNGDAQSGSVAAAQVLDSYWIAARIAGGGFVVILEQRVRVGLAEVAGVWVYVRYSSRAASISALRLGAFTSETRRSMTAMSSRSGRSETWTRASRFRRVRGRPRPENMLPAGGAGSQNRSRSFPWLESKAASTTSVKVRSPAPERRRSRTDRPR